MMSSSSSGSTQNRNITNAQLYREALQNRQAPTELQREAAESTKRQQQQKQQQQQQEKHNFPPIHPSIIEFANLPIPTEIQDLPPSYIIESDVDIYKYMAQRAHATACVLSQLAHTQGVSLATDNSSLEHDVQIYERTYQHCLATYNLLECLEGDTGYPITMAQEIKAAASSLETSLLVTRPALLLLTPSASKAGAAGVAKPPTAAAAPPHNQGWVDVTSQGNSNSNNNEMNDRKEIQALWINALRRNDLMDLPRTLLLKSSPAELLLTICIAQFRSTVQDDAGRHGMVGLACRHCGLSFWSTNEDDLVKHLTQSVVNHVIVECTKCPVQESARRCSQEFHGQPSESMPLIRDVWSKLRPASSARASIAAMEQQTGNAPSSLVAKPWQNAAQDQHQRHDDDPAAKRRRSTNAADVAEAGVDTIRRWQD